MKRTTLAIAAILLGFSTSAYAEAPWQTCPTPGTRCADELDCVAATCTSTVDGETFSGPCNVCVTINPECVGKDPGTSCGEDMVCVVQGCGEGGGTTDGSESYQLSYACPACSPIGDSDAGGPDATAGLSSDDRRKDGTEADEETSEGCAAGAVGPTDGGTLLAWVVGLLSIARRRRAGA